VAALALGGVFVSVRGLGPIAPGQLVADARQALDRKDWGRAQRALDRLARLRPPTSLDASLRAELEVGRGHPDEAVALLAEIPDGDPLAARGRLVAAQIERSRHRARRTRELLEDALRLDPGLSPARRELILLDARQGRRDDLNLQFRALTRREPLGYEDVFLWTTSFENLWVNETIQPHLEGFLRADPDDRASRLALAGVHVRANQVEQARALLEPLPEDDADAQVLRARIALSQMRLDDVRGILERGPAEHVGLALLRGHYALRNNRPREAARQFRTVLRLEPDNREALEALAPLLKQLKDPEADAIQKRADRWRRVMTLLQRAKMEEPRHEKATLTALAEACEDAGQVPIARAWYRLALEQDPLDPGLQQTLYRLRDPSEVAN
jgi:tetratricopeptide (TPR) repeat protein